MVSLSKFCTMKKVTLNLARLAAQEVAARAATIVNKMTGNPNFPAPAPQLSAISDQVERLKARITEQEAAFRTYQQKSVEVHDEREQLTRLLEEEAAYVQVLSDGDEAIILSSGYDVRQKPVPLGMLPATQNMLVFEGSGDGEVIATWNPLKGARSYVVELSTDVSNPDAWMYQSTTTKAKVVLQGLESGKRIWLRVAAVNAAGKGAYSDPATKTVP